MTNEWVDGSSDDSPTVAVLGLGAMGSRVARRLLDAGLRVRVHNRTPGRDAELVERGAAPATSPADAARGASVVLVCVRDDEAALLTWQSCLPGMARAGVGVDLSTLSPGGTDAVSALVEQHGRSWLAAPMVGSRPQLDGGQLRLLVGGDLRAMPLAEHVLAVIAGSPHQVHHVGTPRQAAVAKLVVNGLLVAQLAAVGELLSFTADEGGDPAVVRELLAGLPVTSPALARSLPRIAVGDTSPAFPLDLVAKDLSYLGASGEQRGRPVVSALAAAVHRAARTHGPDRDVVALGIASGAPPLDEPGTPPGGAR